MDDKIRLEHFSISTLLMVAIVKSYNLYLFVFCVLSVLIYIATQILIYSYSSAMNKKLPPPLLSTKMNNVTITAVALLH